MNIKLLQVMLVVAAVLCGVGVAGTFGRGEGAMPAEFNPPDWLRSLGGLAGGPRLDARGLTRNGRPFPAELRLEAGEKADFTVAVAGGTDVRRAEFAVRGHAHIQYRPVSGQTLTGKPVRAQHWPTTKNPGAEPTFLVYERGGTITIHNRGPSTARIALED